MEKVKQEWEEFDNEWVGGGWEFEDGSFLDEKEDWKIKEILDWDKFYNPILAIATNE